MPSEIELQTCRAEYRNQFGYSIDFIQDYDLFGENLFFSRAKKGLEANNLIISTNEGQLNITTDAQKNSDLPDIQAEINALIAKERMKRGGNLALEMNFTPVLAHRYVQRQINDICKAVYSEKSLNEHFRNEEFKTL